MKYIIYNYCGTRKETIVDMTNYEALKGLGLKPEKVYMENGQMIVEVADYSNILNKREYQKLLEQYKKNGMIIKQTFLGGVSRGLTAAKMYDALGKEKYEKLYTDGAGAEAMSYVSSMAEPLALGLVLSNMPATSTSGKTGSGNSEAAACFIAGTLVYGRENKRIEDLRVGDYVYSYNELTKCIEEKKVSKVFKHEVNEVLELHLEDREVITTTKEHAFYVDGEYVEAWKLTAGMFLTGKDFGKVRIDDVKNQPKEEVRVYNIEGEGNHNYFVGESFVLVHNKPMSVTQYHSKKIYENGLDTDHLSEFSFNSRKEVSGAHVERVFTDKANYDKSNKVLRIDNITESKVLGIKEMNYSISSSINADGSLRAINELNFKSSYNGKTVFDDKIIPISEIKSWGYEAAQNLYIGEDTVIRGTAKNGIVFEYWPSMEPDGAYRFYPTILE